MNNTYVTLLGTDNYLQAVLNLYKSYLMVNSKYPFVVIAYDTLSEETFRKLSEAKIKYYIFKDRQFGFILRKNKDYRTTLGKFYAWCLPNIDYFCFVDADFIFLENIDDIFDGPIPIYLTTPYQDNNIHGCLFVDHTDPNIFKKVERYVNISWADEPILNYIIPKEYIRDKWLNWNKYNTRVWHENSYLLKAKYWMMGISLEEQMDELHERIRRTGRLFRKNGEL